MTHSDETSEDGRLRVLVEDRHWPPTVEKGWDLKHVYDSTVTELLESSHSVERDVSVWVFEARPPSNPPGGPTGIPTVRSRRQKEEPEG